ncbi:hypothetical protein KC960_04785 [Candidatus Saccharibacteria bacterium]|nr:hypothetical protein [Candidatus Saccharibacteria bacterium]
MQPNNNQQKPKKPFYKRPVFIILIVAPYALMTIIGIITAALNYEKPPAKDDFSAETERNTTAPRFDVKVVGNSYADPTSRRVTFTVTNLTQEELTPACSVTVDNPAGTYNGYEYVTWDEPLAPGERGYFEGLIIITNEGAAYANQSRVVCS